MDLISKLTFFSSTTYRNTIGFSEKDDTNYFDDLTDNKEEMVAANFISNHLSYVGRLTEENLFYNAVDYVFQRGSWAPSRYGDGSFPIWYSSVEIETSFFETVFHWKNSILSDANFAPLSKNPIYMTRTIFDVQCQGDLVDLRGKETSYPWLLSDDYQECQNIGARLHTQGFPAILSPSARKQRGNNVAVMQKTVLGKVGYQGNYIYEFLPGIKPSVKVYDHKQEELLLIE